MSKPQGYASGPTSPKPPKPPTSSGPGAPPLPTKPSFLFSRRLLTVPLGGGRHVRVEYVFSPCDHGKHPKRCGRCRLRIAAARVQS